VENRKRSLAHSSDDEVGSGGIVGRILNYGKDFRFI